MGGRTNFVRLPKFGRRRAAAPQRAQPGKLTSINGARAGGSRLCGQP